MDNDRGDRGEYPVLIQIVRMGSTVRAAPRDHGIYIFKTNNASTQKKRIQKLHQILYP